MKGLKKGKLISERVMHMGSALAIYLSEEKEKKGKKISKKKTGGMDIFFSPTPSLSPFGLLPANFRMIPISGGRGKWRGGGDCFFSFMGRWISGCKLFLSKKIDLN